MSATRVSLFAPPAPVGTKPGGGGGGEDSPAPVLRVELVREVFANEDPGRPFAVWAVVDVERGDACTAKGEFAAWGEVGDVVRLQGKWVEDPRYGQQFQAQGLLPDVPEGAGEEGLARWLERQPRIGRVTAGLAAAAVGAGGIEDFAADDLMALGRAQGAVPVRFRDPLRAAAARAKDDLDRARVLAWCLGHGLGQARAQAVWDAFGAGAIERVTADPWCLADLDGFGFVLADGVAAALGVAPLASSRLRAAVVHTVRGAAAEDGHVYLPGGEVVQRADGVLRDIAAKTGYGRGALAALTPGLARALQAAVAAAALDSADGGRRVYLPYLRGAEETVREWIAAASAADAPELCPRAAALALAARPGVRGPLDDVQAGAVAQALCRRASVLTGGPGTGKTLTTTAVIAGARMLGIGDAAILLAAPTGRAARRMHEVTGLPAKTIHRLLEYSPAEGFGRNAEEPLEGRLLILDEGCFDARTPVLLADGTWRFISVIVNRREPVEVMSYDARSGRLEPKRVVQWWKYPRTSNLMEIDASRSDSRRRMRRIRCTPQHLIATPEGYRAAGSLAPGDRVLVRGRFLTEFQRQIFLGSLLGDGGLSGFGGYRKCSYRLTFTHGQKQSDYLAFKMSHFPGLFTCPPRGIHSGYCGGRVWRATMNLVDEIDDIVPIYCSEGLHTPAEAFFDLLDARGLAIWYLDNGHLHTTSCGTAYVTLHTERYAHRYQKAMARWLERRLGGQVTIQRYRDYECLRLNKEASRRFLDVVEPYIPPCMAYKHRNPALASFSPVPEASPQVGEVVVRRVSPTTGRQSHYVYDLGVEGHHSYIAGNIVVHNSMIDMPLMAALLAAVPPKMSVLFVGDADQLPPVGPGAPFHHLCRAAPLPVARLECIYRTDAGGSVAHAAREVNAGRAPEASAGDAAFRAAVFPRAPRHLPQVQQDGINRRTREAMAGRVVDEVRRMLAAGARPAGVQVLVPMRKGPLGTGEMNAALRPVMNPLVGRGGVFRTKGGGREFWVGDRVVQGRNDYDKGVFNGEQGAVVAAGGPVRVKVRGAEVERPGFVVEYPDGDGVRRAEYWAGDCGDVSLAFACTVHKAQGGEFSHVVFALGYDAFKLLSRCLVYTAVSRARDTLTLVLEEGAMERAVANAEEMRRYQQLGTKVQERVV